jgi:hypothetical protein
MNKLSAIALASLLAAATHAAHAVDDIPPTFDEVIALLNLDPSIKDRALAGEIVTYDRKDSMDRELALALVAVFDRPYADVIDALRGNRLFQFNEFILDVAEIEGPADESKFAGIGYTIDEIGEVKALLAAGPGETFNLSAEEIRRLEALRGRAEGLDDAALLEMINEALREFLAERLRRYQDEGLDGIASYQRSRKKTISPSEELDAANRAMEDMRRSAPNFHGILQNFPGARIREIEHRFYVFKLDIAGRPGFVLSHRIYFFGAEFALLAERHIYSPHFYNSLQLVAGVIPHESKTVVFYGSRTYTDQVAGFGSGVKHAVGGKELAEGIRKLMGDIRSGVESGQADGP